PTARHRDRRPRSWHAAPTGSCPPSIRVAHTISDPRRWLLTRSWATPRRLPQGTRMILPRVRPDPASRCTEARSASGREAATSRRTAPASTSFTSAASWLVPVRTTQCTAVTAAALDTRRRHSLLPGLDGQPAGGATAGWPAALNAPATTAALHGWHRDRARPRTVATLAAEPGLSRAPSARRFTALLGQPP